MNAMKKKTHKANNLHNALIWTEHSGNYLVFYISHNGSTHMLYRGHFSSSVYRFYRNGVRYCRAIDHSFAKHNKRLCEVMEYIPKAAKYVLMHFDTFDAYSASTSQYICCA